MNMITGNFVMLSDGRRYKKVGNMWQEMSSGMRLNENTMQFMVSSAAFGGDASSGGGSKKSLLDIGVYGTFELSNWVRAAYAGTDSIDFVLIGDSNVGFPAAPGEIAVDGELNGFTDGIVAAGLSLGFQMYGTPIYYPAISGTNIGIEGRHFSNGTGTSGFGGTGNLSGLSYGPAALSAGFSGGTFGGLIDGITQQRGLYPFSQPPDYIWRSLGQTWGSNSNEYKLELEIDHPFQPFVSAGNPLYYRLLVATQAPGGTFGVNVRQSVGEALTGVNSYPNIRITPSAVVGAGVTWGSYSAPTGFTTWNAVNIGYTSAWSTTNDIQFSISASGSGAPSLYPIGNIGIGLNSAFVKRKGIAAHPLVYRGGANATLLAQDMGGYSSVTTSDAVTSMRIYLKEVSERQSFAKDAVNLQQGKICVFIQLGMNLEPGINPTEAAANYLTAIKSLITQVTNEWAKMNSDLIINLQGLQFLVFTSHATASPDEPYKFAYRAKLQTNLIADLTTLGITNVTLIDITRHGGDYTTLTNSEFYDLLDPAHLDGYGYRDVCNAILTSLLARTSTTHV